MVSLQNNSKRGGTPARSQQQDWRIRVHSECGGLGVGLAPHSSETQTNDFAESPCKTGVGAGSTLVRDAQSVNASPTFTNDRTKSNAPEQCTRTVLGD